jgi:release factor glutamine methyltransferase
MNVIEKLKEVSLFLKSKGIEDAAKEAELLITETLRIDKSRLYIDSFELLPEISLRIDDFARRRVAGEPIQYLIGHVDFYGLKINVGEGVLIPRPETELLVEEAIKQIKERFRGQGSRFTVLDLCTGSGCIALALARHLPEAFVCGVDRSEAAIRCAQQNARENNIENVFFMAGDLLKPVADMQFNCIVSNPPYIKTGDIPALQREIRDHEPPEALNGGEDGLNFYRNILMQSPRYLKKKGIIVMEVGFGQWREVEEIAYKAGISPMRFVADYSGIKRIMVGEIDNAAYV